MAAVGQPIIMQAYSQNFKKANIKTAQVLLTRDDFDNREKYLNARNTLLELLHLGAIAIINENDTIAVEEINFGDNDTLAALVSVAVEADILIICTDVKGLYAGKPGHARLISYVDKITKEIENYASGESSSGMGRGGMATKISAAKIATASGIDAMIIHNAKCADIKTIIEAKNGGTFFAANKGKLNAKKSWIAFSKKARGALFIDEKAANALVDDGKSLLAIGVVGIKGIFKKGDAVFVSKLGGSEFAVGLVNFDSSALSAIRGKTTQEIKKFFPDCQDEVIHRDNLIIF
jgi:glutamate 5-kinase